MTAPRLLAATLAALTLAACSEHDTPTPRPPRLKLSVSTLTFTAQLEGADPAARAVTVTNAGNGTLAKPEAVVTYQGGAGWLTAEVSGTAAPFTLTVTAARGALAQGSYAGTVTLTAPGADNSPALGVTFTVGAAPPAALSLSASTLAFSSPAVGTDPAAQALQVDKVGAGALPAPTTSISYPAGGATGWLSAAVTGSAPPYTVTVTAATAGQPLGLHTATLSVASAGAPNSPRTVAVELALGRVVTVSRLITHWAGDAAGTTAVAADPGVSAVVLSQPDGAGGFTVTTMKPAAEAGRWRAGVKPGAYQAKVAFADGSSITVGSSADDLDLGEDRGGRADVAQATQPTQATLTLGGLDTWQGFDSLRFFSWGAQLARPLVPTADWTGFSDPEPYAFDWAALLGPLLVAGDDLVVAQYRFGVGEQVATIEYREAVAVTALDAATQVTIADGQPFALSPPAATLVHDLSGLLPLDWRQTEFELAGADFAPAPLSEPHRVGVYAIPAPLAAPSPLGAAAATLVEASFPAIALDVDAGTLTYARFLPPQYREYLEAAYELPAPVRFSATAAPLPGAVNQVLRRDALTALPSPVGPALGAPQAPSLNDLDALVARVGVPATPLLKWFPPNTGVATSMRLEVWRLTSADGLTTQGARVARWVLPGAATELELPVGTLAAGGTYAIRLAARSCPADAGEATPYRAGVPFAEGVLWTAAFTVASPP
ncbi:MAG: hypothetical protein IPQ24_04950 [Anaeromyxobacter sp.]|nr:hypothetical protein [Anaeromyxobacter sp.]